MPDVTAFEPVTVDHAPSVVLYQGTTYRSDRSYTDRAGATWRYYGLYDGASMWVRDGDDTAWNITALVDEFGPLTEGAAS